MSGSAVHKPHFLHMRQAGKTPASNVYTINDSQCPSEGFQPARLSASNSEGRVISGRSGGAPRLRHPFSRVLFRGDDFISLSSLMAATGVPTHQHGGRLLSLDPASSQDAFGMAVVCRPANSKHVYVEHVQALRQPGFSQAMDDVAATARVHDIGRIITDQMSQAPITEDLRRRGSTSIACRGRVEARAVRANIIATANSRRCYPRG